jgi:hypothetical protein
VAGEAPSKVERVGRGLGGPGRVRGQVWPGWRWPGRLGSGATNVGPGVAAARGAVGSGGARRYTVCGRDARERSGRKKGQGQIYSLMFVKPTHQPTNISKLAYVATDEHKLHTSILKPTNVIRNINVGPDEYKKTDE